MMSEENKRRIDVANIVITAKDKETAENYANEVKNNFFDESYPVALIKKLKSDFEWLITLAIDEDMAYESRDEWLYENDEEDYW
jgi:hypothetical protein